MSLLRDNQPVLHDFTVRLTEHRIGLVGNNGSGKSSLVRLLNGLLQPATGSVRVGDQDPSDGPESMASQVGFIFQNPDHQLIFPTVQEELTFGLKNLGLSRSEAESRAQACLREHEREDWADRPVHSLSEGQKQLVCILAVLVMQPQLIVLDEPFSALDLPTRWHLLDWMHSLPQQLLMISHDLDTLTDFDRILWLEDGRLRGDGHPNDILPAYREACRGQEGRL
ncbi:cobalt ABC transporter [Saccharospirillum salsuginis]|uniref:Cobalt ABC transporter n=1 Tax=Saccharospirillum salsuginis TaxID=418750 RepID=A0A918KLT2_9GAMM|nr:cobalt ABC transporter [Saccharospirillum salsuginis]